MLFKIKGLLKDRDPREDEIPDSIHVLKTKEVLTLTKKEFIGGCEENGLI